MIPIQIKLEEQKYFLIMQMWYFNYYKRKLETALGFFVIQTSDTNFQLFLPDFFDVHHFLKTVTALI